MRLIDFTTTTQPEPGRVVDCNTYTYSCSSHGLQGTVRLDLIDSAEVLGTVMSPDQARALAHQLLRCALLAEIELDIRTPRISDLPAMPGRMPMGAAPTAASFHPT